MGTVFSELFVVFSWTLNPNNLIILLQPSQVDEDLPRVQ